MYKHKKSKSRCPKRDRILSFIVTIILVFNIANYMPVMAVEAPVTDIQYDQAVEINISEIIMEPEADYQVATVNKPELIVEIESELSSDIDISLGVYNGPHLTKRGGVYRNPNTGLKETWYSQRVLPGRGLKIPGRHVNEEGFVCDEDGYICVASSTYPKGTIIETSRGMGKVYDSGCAPGILDIYVDW